jgi:hypothetical protein
MTTIRRDAAQQFYEELRALDERALDALFDLVVAQGQLADQLAEFLFRKGRGDLVLLDRLLDAMEPTRELLLRRSGNADWSRLLGTHVANRPDGPRPSGPLPS